MNQGSTERIKLSGNKGDLSVFDSTLVIVIISFLPPTALANVGRTCRRFGSVRDGQRRSLANETARQMFESAATEYEIYALPRYGNESEISWLRQLNLLRERFEFGQLIGNNIRYASAETKSSVSTKYYGCYSSALSNHVMRRGKHYVTFNITNGLDDRCDNYHIYVGLIRPLPGWDEKELDSFNPARVGRPNVNLSRDLRAERTERWGTSDVNCCSYSCGSGDCNWSNWSTNHCEEWEGQRGHYEDGTVGLDLDLDEGTLIVNKNGRRLGVMKDGLSGEYCWFTSIHGFNGIIRSVGIERGTLP